MGKLIDITGQKFGHLTVVQKVKSRNGQSMWLCKCSCGNTTIQSGGNLRKGTIKSCGHLRNDKTERQKIAHRTIAKEKHGDSGSRLYGVWLNMRRRCDYPNDISYSNYGGRGIKVCDEWDTNFLAFKEWAMSAGYNPNAKRGECTLDRIDTDGDYCPENCRWQSMLEQSNNRRNSYTITYNNETHTAAEWENITGIPKGVIYARYKAGKTPEEILSKNKYGQHGEIVGRY